MSAVICIPQTERMMGYVYHILDMCQSYWTQSNLESIQRSSKPRSEICVLCIYFLGVSWISQQSHSQSGFHEMKVAQILFCLQCCSEWSIIAMKKEDVTTPVPQKFQILCKVLPSTKLSLPSVQVISSLGIESRLFRHNWNAGHNYGPLLTHCDIVPGAATISQLHKHTLVCFCYYHSLPKTQMSVLITDCHHTEPSLAATLCPSLQPLGSSSA